APPADPDRGLLRRPRWPLHRWYVLHAERAGQSSVHHEGAVYEPRRPERSQCLAGSLGGATR
ncbi:hypothetical protein, partial [Streptococcus pneumoniae]|uniref:hypothetical protein n=1 Tax=Streptococcus pneumoniae TaxID=1313 RepID=UPI0019530712